MAAPLFKVEVAFGQGPNTAAPSYTDISAYVRREPPLRYQRGNTDETQQLQSGSMSFVVDNRDGRFTAGSSAASSAWGSTLTIRHPVRLSIWNGTSYVVEWTGTVDDWGTGYVGGVQALTQVTCSDRIAQAGRIQMPPTMYAEVLLDNPLLFLPLDEEDGSQTIHDLSVNRFGPFPLRKDSGESRGFTASIGPENQAALSATRVFGEWAPFSAIGYGLGVASATAFTIEGFVSANGNDSTASVVCIWGNTYIRFAGTPSALQGAINAGPYGTPTASSTQTAVMRDVLSHVAMTASLSGGNWTSRLYINGAEVASDVQAGAAFTLDDNLAFLVGAAGSGTATLSGVAVYTSALSASRIAAHAAAATGWEGELSGARWNRLCRLAGLDSSWYTADTGTVEMGPLRLAGQTLAQALEEVAAAEQGVAFCSSDGKLTLKQQSSRYNPSSALTIAPTTLETDLGFTVNDAYLVNDATVAAASGAEARDADETSIAAYGTYRASDSINALIEGQAYNLASWLTYKYATPQPRADQFTINQTQRAATVSATTLLGIDVNSCITLSPLPSSAPASSVPLLIDGLAGQVGDTWSVTFYTSPTTRTSCWILGTSTLGTSTITLY